MKKEFDFLLFEAIIYIGLMQIIASRQYERMVTAMQNTTIKTSTSDNKGIGAQIQTGGAYL